MVEAPTQTLLLQAALLSAMSKQQRTLRELLFPTEETETEKPSSLLQAIQVAQAA